MDDVTAQRAGEWHTRSTCSLLIRLTPEAKSLCAESGLLEEQGDGETKELLRSKDKRKGEALPFFERGNGPGQAGSRPADEMDGD